MLLNQPGGASKRGLKNGSPGGMREYGNDAARAVAGNCGGGMGPLTVDSSGSSRSVGLGIIWPRATTEPNPSSTPTAPSTSAHRRRTMEASPVARLYRHGPAARDLVHEN